MNAAGVCSPAACADMTGRQQDSRGERVHRFCHAGLHCFVFVCFFSISLVIQTFPISETCEVQAFKFFEQKKNINN